MKWASKKLRRKLLKIDGWHDPSSIDVPFTAAEIKELELTIAGNVVLPSDPNYNVDRLLSNFAFQRYPTLIVYCEVFTDVRHCLAFAQAHRLPVAIRSGGHSTAGLSINDGLVIDLSRLRYVSVDPTNKLARVGAGATFEHLDATLDAFHLHVPAGGCGDVCVAGFMQGGGYGYTSRKFGLNCDNVVSVVVMLADGSIVVASDTDNADLFWALRGGLGGNLGVVLEITYRLHHLGALWGFRIEWPLEPSAHEIDNAARALAVLQAEYMRDGITDDLGYMAFLAWQGGVPCLMLRGMFNGAPAEGRQALASLLQCPGAKLTIDQVGSYRELDELFIQGSPALPDVPDVAREDKESGFIARLLTPEDWHKVLTKFLETPNRSSMLGIEPYGGAISRVGCGDTSFIHRDAYMNVFLDVFWVAEEARAEAVGYLDQFMSFMATYTNGQSCQTYPRLGQADYRRRYWGEWFDTLLAVKKKYDPDNVFTHAFALVPERHESADPPLHGLRQLTQPIRYESWSVTPQAGQS
jgi:hypothetical protein